MTACCGAPRAWLQQFRSAQSQRQGRERQLARVLEAVQAARARLAAAPPEAAGAIRAQIAAQTNEAERLRGAIASARAREQQLLSQAGELRAQARAAAASARPPESLRQQVRQLASNAASLASNAASLERQQASLEAQGAALQAQGAELQAEAADLQEQQAQLEQLQKTAQQQQKQAESLQNQLTQELTKAGGDARGTDPRLVTLQDDLGAAPGVDLVSPPQINKSGSAVVYSVIATTAPSDPETADLVEELRSTTIPEATAGEDVQAYVGGSTASNVDLAAEITSRLPVVIIVVLLLSIIVLTIAFRSLLVPLQAAVTNVLCVGAAFGILTAAFQWGWGIDVLGIETDSDSVPIASYVPLMMFAVLFGLSMDYQVFLLSAVAMRRQVGDDDKRAIAWGMEHSGPVITAAGLIMIGVFGSFILNGDPTVKQFGVGLASAVALAASAVLVLVPAVLTLLGKWAWWMPGWLGKVVPTVDIEGEGLAAAPGRGGDAPRRRRPPRPRGSRPPDGPEPRLGAGRPRPRGATDRHLRDGGRRQRGERGPAGDPEGPRRDHGRAPVGDRRLHGEHRGLGDRGQPVRRHPGAAADLRLGAAGVRARRRSPAGWPRTSRSWWPAASCRASAAAPSTRSRSP